MTGQSPDQALLTQALKFAANAIFITDKTGKIVWVNEAFSRLSGYNEEDTIGRAPNILKSGRQNASFYGEFWKTILSGQVWQGQLTNRRKNGSLYTSDEIITPLFDEQGAITHFVAIQHDITQREQTSERERHLAYHDILTDLPNRAYFLDTQREAISEAKLQQNLLAMLFVDLDGFKQINDIFGHHTGDQLLITVANRLRRCVREVDTIARFGGDEFAVLITGFIDKDIPAVMARKLLNAIRRPFMLRGQSVNIGASIGIAIFPVDGEDTETLLSHADQAMYRAKSNGGNDYLFYSSALASTN